jgi:uncharacterized membrane protein YcaP (DUF421 family)
MSRKILGFQPYEFLMAILLGLFFGALIASPFAPRYLIITIIAMVMILVVITSLFDRFQRRNRR